MDLNKVKKLNIPKTPGCYLYKDKSGKVIYVGKAVDLRSRVLSYWRPNAGHTPAKYAMLKEIADIELVLVDSEIEAILLEANLIKKFQPHFNVMLRDDKRHVYIKVSTEEEWPRVFSTRTLDKAGRYFGPFVSVEAVRETLKAVRKIWPFRSCRTLPKRSCLYYRIGKCPGMCEGHITSKEYSRNIKQILLFLEGRKHDVVKDIEKEIKRLEKQSVLNDEEERRLNFLKYQNINIRKVLSGTNILSLMDKYASDVVELAKTLSLPRVPERIEGYDISNIFGQLAVGSMVVFTGGEPNKAEYRKFKIKVAHSGGDVAMLKEILERRFNHDWPKPDLVIIDGGKAQLNVVLKILKQFNLDIPCLAVSKGQGLRSAIAPDKIFFPGQNTALVLPLASPALHIIKRVRDEAHRFAIGYHRDLKSKF